MSENVIAYGEKSVQKRAFRISGLSPLTMSMQDEVQQFAHIFAAS